MSIVLVGSTSGSVTLQEPAVAGTTVLTLPTVSGTILTTASSGQSIPKAALPTGSVLQVVQGTLTSQFSSTSTSFVDTGLSASITPITSSSKILISFTSQVLMQVNGALIAADIYRNGSSLSGESTYGYVYLYTAGAQPTAPLVFQYLDSPATTSSTTYKIYARSNNSTTWYFGGSNSPNVKATITLMEIAA
jgi:hypothetical protein